MNFVFVLAVLAIYAAAFAVTRRPWIPWAIFSAVCTTAAAAMVLFTDLADDAPSKTTTVASPTRP
jgi:hypothetical protein